jgi:hypothetical protein
MKGIVDDRLAGKKREKEFGILHPIPRVERQRGY